MENPEGPERGGASVESGVVGAGAGVVGSGVGVGEGAAGRSSDCGLLCTLELWPEPQAASNKAAQRAARQRGRTFRRLIGGGSGSLRWLDYIATRHSEGSEESSATRETLRSG